MTPEEARRLLDGTTPGPWFFDDTIDGRVLKVGPIAPYGYELECSTDDASLAAHAPAMAATIAGMREEWGVTCEEVAGPTTFTYGEWADSAGKRLTHHTARLLAWEKVRAGYPNVRIVRRYVTNEEEIA